VCESELTLTLASTPHHAREYSGMVEEAIALDPINPSDPYLSSSRHRSDDDDENPVSSGSCCCTSLASRLRLPFAAAYDGETAHHPTAHCHLLRDYETTLLPLHISRHLTSHSRTDISPTDHSRAFVD
jgi:hypothetical protein